MDLLEVDRYGLDQTDRLLLTTIIERFSGGPVGLDTLSAAIGEDAGTIEDVYEPYLIKNGFLLRTQGKNRNRIDLSSSGNKIMVVFLGISIIIDNKERRKGGRIRWQLRIQPRC